MPGMLLTLAVAGLVVTVLLLAFLWRRGPSWWEGWRYWLQFVPAFAGSFWLGVGHGFLRPTIGTTVWIATLPLLLIPAGLAISRRWKALLPPGARDT